MFKLEEKIEKLKKERKELRKQLRDSECERKKFQRLAERDFLTDAYNRHGFIRETERFLKEMNAEQRFKGKRHISIVKTIVILFADIDNLKYINDAFGHKKGDAYIKEISRVLTKTVRDIDVVGRWGGDEFVVALINATGDQAHGVAQKMQHRIAKIRLGKNIDFVCSVSIGLIIVSTAHHRGAQYDLHALIEHADKAMYEAKGVKGKGIIVSFAGEV